MNSERQWHRSVSSVNYEIYLTICNTIAIVTNYFFQRSIKQAFTDRIIPDDIFTTTIFELESLINIIPVTNISGNINEFEYEITNNNSTPP